MYSRCLGEEEGEKRRSEREERIQTEVDENKGDKVVGSGETESERGIKAMRGEQRK